MMKTEQKGIRVHKPLFQLYNSIIHFSERLPEPISQSDLRKLRIIYRKDANRIHRYLLENIPSGTYNKLLDMMLERMEREK